MFNSNLATVFALLILILVACFGYYQGFIVLVTRRLTPGKTRPGSRGRAVALGLLYLGVAVVVSAVAALFYFNL